MMGKENLCRTYEQVLASCPLLAGIPAAEYEKTLHFLCGKWQRLGKHEIFQRLDEPFRYAGIVVTGCIEGAFLNENDAKIAVSRFGAGEFFGEALGCVQPAHSPIQLEALEDSLVILVDLSILQRPQGESTAMTYQLAQNLIRGLAAQNVYQNRKVRILSQKKLRDRIGIFLGEMPRQPDGAIRVELTTTAMAEFLGVNRSALSRELGAMQDEGLLRIEGRRYFLLRPEGAR